MSNDAKKLAGAARRAASQFAMGGTINGDLAASILESLAEELEKSDNIMSYRFDVHQDGQKRHESCPKPAVCDCECSVCKQTWFAAGRPRAPDTRPTINRERWARVFHHQEYIDDPEDRTNYLLDVYEQMMERS